MPQPPPRPSQAERAAQLLLHAIPADIRKSLDSTELNDRVREMIRLSAQAQDPALAAPLRQAAKMRARAVAEAQPRAITERQHRELIAKAAAAPSTAQADAIRRQARELIEERHPVAPRVVATAAVAKAAADRVARRAAAAKQKGKPGKPVRVYGAGGRLIGVADSRAIVTKADGKTEPPVPVFDADGNLIGVCDASDIQRVAGAGQPAPADRAAPEGTAAGTPQPAPAQQQSAAVAKARAAARVPQLVPPTDRLAAVMLQGWREAARKNQGPARRTGRR